MNEWHWKKFWETFYDKMVENPEKGISIVCNKQNINNPFLPTQTQVKLWRNEVCVWNEDGQEKNDRKQVQSVWCRI